MVFFFSCYVTHRALHSFPTRRSSDLVPADIAFFGQKDYQQTVVLRRMVRDLDLDLSLSLRVCPTVREPDGLALSRSEEHTSELQSLTNLVCRLLLEKKNKKQHYITML